MTSLDRTTSAWTSCRGARVLIVDDDEEMRATLSATLRAAGCEPLLASTGAEAVEIAAVASDLGRASIDLLLIDLHMPGRDGLTVLRLLRRAGILPPAILMTAFPDDDVRADARACSDATEDLRTLADKRKAEADKARAAAAGKAATHEKRADYTLGLRPKNPADMCASMQALGDEWLQGRAKP